MPVDPEDFVRRFATAFAGRDAEAVAGLCTEDAAALSLSGAWAEGRAEIAAIWAADLAGPLRGTRLVTARARLAPVAGDAAMLHQRFVLSGLTDGAGADFGRMGVMLSALLRQTDEGWLAQSLVVAPLA